MTDEAFLRAFGERIRGERARRGMSRKLLADHAGISERYLTQLESGKGNVSIVLLRHVALSDADKTCETCFRGKQIVVRIVYTRRSHVVADRKQFAFHVEEK